MLMALSMTDLIEEKQAYGEFALDSLDETGYLTAVGARNLWHFVMINNNPLLLLIDFHEKINNALKRS